MKKIIFLLSIIMITNALATSVDNLKGYIKNANEQQNSLRAYGYIINDIKSDLDRICSSTFQTGKNECIGQQEHPHHRLTPRNALKGGDVRAPVVRESLERRLRNLRIRLYCLTFHADHPCYGLRSTFCGTKSCSSPGTL